jgi:hypothetical protein
MGAEIKFSSLQDPNIIPTELVFEVLKEVAQQRGVVKYRWMNDKRVTHLQQNPDSTIVPWTYAAVYYNPSFPDHIGFDNQIKAGVNSSYSVREEKFSKRYKGAVYGKEWLEVAKVAPEEMEGMEFSFTSIRLDASGES